MNNTATNRSEIRLLGTLFFILLALYLLSLIFESQVKRNDLSAPLKLAPAYIEGVEISARAAYVYDTRTGMVLYAKNENEKLPLASLTKVMTALVAIELAPSERQIIVERDALKSQGDSGLKAGDRWSLKDLLDFSLTSSSNDGAEAVALALGALSRSNATPKEAEADFVLQMNKRASELGLSTLNFENVTGLDKPSGRAGAYGSAKDMAMLFDYILKNHPEILEATKEEEFKVDSKAARYTATNTDVIVNEIPGIRASKTGYTDAAGGNLVVAFDPELGHTVIISVLGSSFDGRFEDVRRLVEASLKSIVDSN